MEVFWRMNNTRNCSRELPKYFASEMLSWFWGATLRFSERGRMHVCESCRNISPWKCFGGFREQRYDFPREAVCTYAYEYFTLKNVLPYAPSSFLPHNTYMPSPFWVEVMRLRVVGETMKPQGTRNHIRNILVVVGTSRRVTTLSGHSDDLSCIFTNNTGSAAAAAPVRLFALLRLWQF